MLELDTFISPEIAEYSDEVVLSSYRDDRARTDYFDILVERYHVSLLRYLTGYLKDAHAAEDVMQNFWIQIQTKAQLYKGGSVQSWLYSIATHVAINYLRKYKKHPTVSLSQAIQGPEGIASEMNTLLAVDVPPAIDIAILHERTDIVAEELGNLSANAREIIVLVFYNGLKYREISDRLNLSIGTVKSRLHCSIQQLRKHVMGRLK